jgi:Immunoglobulin I-set domain/Immunoglobulin domain/Regulator of chromosome condensation (RCC1) repeat
MNPSRNFSGVRWTTICLTLLVFGAAEVTIWGQAPGILAGPITNSSNGHTYYLLEPASWTNAEAAAVALGGHLVTLNSRDENTWVYNTFSTYDGISRDLWIGLYIPDPADAPTNRTERLAQFKWISGQPVEVLLLGESNLVLSGYCKMTGPTNSFRGFEGYWIEELPNMGLRSVAELPLPLEIIAQPKSISVGIGANATFQVFADGTTPLHYQWQSSGTELHGETKSTLTLTNVQPNQSGSFSVVVSNASGSITSAPAFLSVAGIVGWGAMGAFDFRTNIPSGLTSVLAIAAGDRHDLALKPDGTVVGWGENDYHQLEIPADLTNVVAIAGALYHSLALKADGTVVSWGYNLQTGNWVPDGLTNVVAIDACGYDNLALLSDGTVQAWGGGDGARQTVTAPGLSNIVAIAAGDGHFLALKSDGSVVDWEDTTGNLLPVPPAATNVVAISAGTGDSLVLKADGTLLGWGQDWVGQLEISPGLTNVVAICARSLHSLALRNDGTVVGWGNNYGGESTVPPRLPNVVAIAGGYNHSLALLRDGSPKFTVQPWDQMVSLGRASRLAAKAVGVQSMRFQWQLNGQAIPGATNDTLNIANAQPSDAGTYTLTVSNPVGVVSSRRAKLVVTPELRLQALSLGGQNETFQATGPTGYEYTLQASADLGTWTDLQTRSGSVMPVKFSVINPAAASQQFYRVRLGAAAGN